MKFLFFNLQLSGTLGKLANQFLDSLPRFLMAVVILIIGFIVSKIIASMFKKFLQRIGIDKLGEKLTEIEIINKSNINIVFSSFLSKVIYYLLMIFFLVMATDVLKMPAISNLVTSLFELIPNIIVALIILVLGTLLAEELRKIVQSALDSLGVPSARLIATFLFYFIFINIALTALKQANIDTEFLQQNISLLIAGVVLAFAIGYGFASKNSVSNFLASFYTQDKIKIGSKINIDGASGVVTDIDKSTLTLRVDDSKTILIPLHKLSEEKIEIFNKQSKKNKNKN